MKLLSTEQIRDWDRYTIQHEPIAAIDLMERASSACVDWLLQNFNRNSYYIFCGKGNNGGDGLAIARLLQEKNIDINVFILENNVNGCADFQTNLERLRGYAHISITFIKKEGDFPPIPPKSIVIDALFGTGLNKPLEKLAGKLVTHINSTRNKIIVSIDMPSGLFADSYSAEHTIIKATHTLTFQCFKLALLIPCNEIYFGNVHILNIQLLPEYLDTIETKFQTVDKTIINKIYQPRKPFSHKGTYGHALLVAGSYGKMGAAVLCTKACLRSGAGLVTTHVPKEGVDVLQISAPEAMCKIDPDNNIVTQIVYDLSPYSSIGIGPGIGKDSETAELLYKIVNTYQKPIVIDADALNILSEHKEWLNILPKSSILTPHPKEFERLFGNNLNDFEKIETALQKAAALNITIILKGHRTFIATTNGEGYFNTTGNAGMAKGGSGDILTGIIAGLLAQGYSSADAAILGVYLHGLAGDKIADRYCMDAITSGDLIKGLKLIKL